VLGRLFGRKSKSRAMHNSPVLSDDTLRALRKADDLGHLAPNCELARYDTLGQTLIAIIVIQALSGPDAERLAEELAARFRGDILVPGSVPGATPRPRHLVIDLQNVEYMDSGAIGSLVSLLTQLHKLGGNIALVNTHRNVQFLFKLTRLDRLFPICTDVLKAIERVERGG
jgi:hypothetical protein